MNEINCTEHEAAIRYLAKSQLVDYFAAHEATMPPPAFYQREFKPNPLKAKNGAPLPTSDPSPEELAGAIAKWRFLMADAMVKESQKRG